jgi:hypothetical protein
MLRKFMSIGFQFPQEFFYCVSIYSTVFSPVVLSEVKDMKLLRKTHLLIIISEIHSESLCELSQTSGPEEENFYGRNITEKSGILSRATSPLSLRSQDSSSSRKAHQIAEGTVVNHCICDKQGLGKTQSKPSPGNKQENREPCHFWRRDS